MIEAFNWMHSAPTPRAPRERSATELTTWFARAWENCRARGDGEGVIDGRDDVNG